MIRTNRNMLILAGLALGFASSPLLSAEPITWTTWNSANSGSPGTASGTMALGPGVTVTYNGQLGGLENDTDWGPSTSYVGGNVSNAPPSTVVPWMTGGQGYTETITFSQAVLDPTMAFWSLGGQYGITAEYDFASNDIFSIQACGPSDNIGGGCLTQNGQTLYGEESNGTIQFAGTYTSLSFTTPVNEYWWDFTVGAAGLPAAPPPPPPPPSSVTPEPASLALLGTGLTGLVGLVKRRRIA